MNKLTFEQVREANLKRLPQFRDRQGNLAHSKADGSDWSIERWMNAFYGECGEASGELKKAARGDYGTWAKSCFDNGHLKELPADVKLKIQREFADILTYLDLAASQLDTDLGDAFIEKFNVVSARVKSDITIVTLIGGAIVVSDDREIPF